jgi:phosphate acetyltransferase
VPHTLLLAPAGRQVGLTTACLGLVRALDREGLRVAYVKPIAARGDRSAALMKLGAGLAPPEPISRADADQLLAAGDDQTLMERVVALCRAAGEGADVLVVEGMAPEPGMVHSTRVDALMVRALDAELVLVGSPRGETPGELASAIAIAAHGYGAHVPGRAVSCILNRVTANAAQARADEPRAGWVKAGLDEEDLGASEIAAYRAALEAEGLHPVAIVPSRWDLAAPRVKDLADFLGAEVLHAGDQEKRRIRHVALCAMTVPNALRAFVSGALVITPGDRSDILLAASLAVLGGTPLAGLLLTGGLKPDPRVLGLCQDAIETGLPILSVELDSYPAASAVAAMPPRIPLDDAERVDRVMNAVADRIDPAWVKTLARPGRRRRLSPPAFRHRLVESARAAQKRIVLPEGTEPRTVAAAAIVEQRGIARCVLLGEPGEVREVARKQGITLPASLEIIDPASLAPRYVQPLVERRSARGMTPEKAEAELGDAIMVGTMMMALDEADGLVSGAVHTTAHTIRPALQLIKTVPGCDLVSSVFFMCLPEQVLVFGDCAVNPNPTAAQLADIAVQSADSARAFGVDPRVAMLSYSTGTSGGGEDVAKVKLATDLARKLRPDLLVDGPLQYDAAIVPEVGRQKAPTSAVAGQATVFVFPDLNTGNVTYKAVQRSANVVSIGPMLQGLAKPVNDLSRGCLVEDIVFTIALTAIQAQQRADAR